MSSRAIRITLGLVVVLLVALFVVDRLTVRFVADQIATQAQTSQQLTAKPSVSIGGALFLPQVVRGNYQDIDVDVRGSVSNGLRIDRVHAYLDDVKLPLSRVLSRDVTKIPVGSLNADVELTYDDLNTYLAAQQQAASPQGAEATPPKITYDNGAIKVDSTVDILGTNYPVQVVTTMGVEPAAVTFTPRDLSASVLQMLPEQWREQVRQLLTFRVPIEGLPFNLKLTGADTLADRLRFTAAGKNVILDTTQLATPAGTTPTPTG